MRRATALLITFVLLTPAATAGWTQFRGGPDHTATSPTHGAIQAVHERWSYQASGHVLASPAVATVDGQVRIFLATYPGTGAGSVVSLTGAGQEVWSATPSGLTSGGFLSSPAVADADGDGALEVLIGKLEDATLYMYDAASGSQEASFQMGQANRDLLASSPMVADVDPTSPGPEVLLGGSRQGTDGSLVLLSGDLSTVLFEHELNAPAWSTPLVADLDGDGRPEIAVSTGVPDTGCLIFGTLHPTNNPKRGDDAGRLYLFDRAGGSWAPAWDAPLAGPTLASPVAGDIDGDGTPELVVGAQGPRGSCSDPGAVQGTGYLHAFEPGSPTEIARSADISSMAGVSSPVLFDVDDDGDEDVLQGVWDGLRAYALGTGSLDQVRVYQAPQNPQGADEWVAASPALADIDGDGDTDVVGLTMPVNVNMNQITESEVLPGVAFALDAASFQQLWAHRTPEDGGLSGPVPADLDQDGRAEVLLGTGFPTVGQARTLHVLGPINPVIREITWTPEAPTDLDLVTFQADVWDEDTADEDLSYGWTFDDGTSTPTREPQHSFPDDGTYTVTLTVSDPEGHTWTEERTLEVANVAPTVDPQVTTTPGSLTVELRAHAEDPDGTLQEVRWHLDDGTTTTQPQLTHTYPNGGTYALTLTATDDDGATTTVDRQVHVNRFPTLTGPATLQGPEAGELTVRLDATDPDGDALQPSLSGLPGAQAVMDQGQVLVTWTPGYDAAGTHQATVHLRDAGTPSGTAEHPLTVEVWDTDRAPTLGDPRTTDVRAGRTGVFGGTIADADGDAVTVTAPTLPEGASLETTQDRWTVTFPTTREMGDTTHRLDLAATDGNLTTTLQLDLHVLPNAAPQPVLHLPEVVEASTVWDPQPAELTATVTDPDGDRIDGVRWTVEGAAYEGTTVEHAFSQHGLVPVTVEATDRWGARGTATAQVAVDDALTGTLDVLRSQLGTGPQHPVYLQVRLTRDDGTPVPDTRLNVTLVHQGLNQTTAERATRTDASGIATLALRGEAGLPVFLPGEHTVRLEASAQSLPGAAIQDLERVTMHGAFSVDGPLG